MDAVMVLDDAAAKQMFADFTAEGGRLTTSQADLGEKAREHRPTQLTKK
jgi:hypothetical protein